MRVCEWIDFRSHWCLSHYDFAPPEVLLAPWAALRLLSCPVLSTDSSCSAQSSEPRYHCRRSSVFEATTPALIKNLPSDAAPSTSRLSAPAPAPAPQWRNLSVRSWSLAAHRDEVSADFSPRRVKTSRESGPVDSRPPGNSLQHPPEKERRRKRNHLYFFFFFFFFVSSQTGRRLTAGWVIIISIIIRIIAVLTWIITLRIRRNLNWYTRRTPKCILWNCKGEDVSCVAWLRLHGG